MSTRHGSATVTLPSDLEILITRTFEAPATLVWDAITQPRHLLRWWGPDYCPLVACDVDFRVGGAWRYLCRDMDGNELGWHGTYRDIHHGECIVSTEVFEGFPEAQSLNTMTLTEDGGVTTLRTMVRHATKEFRDGHVASGMEGGMQLSFNRLDDLLEVADTTAERFRRVAGRFTDRANEVPEGAWENPAPCDGWTARDVVDHLVTWVPGFLSSSAGIVIQPGPPVAFDPAGAWINFADQLQALLDDPDDRRAGDRRWSDRQADGRVGDRDDRGWRRGLHTWDLARATGLDESLDPAIVTEMLIGMQPMDEMLRQSGHYGPKVEVPDDADDQTKLIAFTGRTP